MKTITLGETVNNMFPKSLEKQESKKNQILESQ